jgi:hypothetical protein
VGLVVLGVALSLGVGALAFFKPALREGRPRLEPRFDLGLWVTQIPAQLSWWLPFVALLATLPFLRAVVWGFTAPAPVPPLSVRFHALALGGLVHNTFPGRAGLLASAWFAARRSQRSVIELLASLMVAKLLELAVLVLAVIAAAPLLGAGAGALAAQGLTTTLHAAAAVLAVTAVIFLALARLGPALVGRLEARGRAPRVARFLGVLSTGVRGVGSWRRLGLGLASAAAPTAVASLAYGLALARLGAPSGIAGGCMMLAAITLGQLTPALPIGAAVYVAVAAWAARALGVDPAGAAALAVLSNAGSIVANVAVGGCSAIRHRGVLRELPFLRGRRASAASPAESSRG